MEVKSNLRQIVVYNAPTPCYYTVNIPGAEGPITVAGNSGPTVANSLKGLFPDFDFIYEKDPSYIYDVKKECLVHERQADDRALIDAALVRLEQTLYEARRKIIQADDEGREPVYNTIIADVAAAFNAADRYFWLYEVKHKAEAARAKARPLDWKKTSSDYDGDKSVADDKDYADWLHKYKPVMKDLPFGVGYGYVTDMKDINKVLKEIEKAFYKKP